MGHGANFQLLLAERGTKDDRRMKSRPRPATLALCGADVPNDEETIRCPTPQSELADDDEVSGGPQAIALL